MKENVIDATGIKHALRVFRRFITQALFAFPISFLLVPILSLIALIFQSSLVFLLLALIAHLTPEEPAEAGFEQSALTQVIDNLDPNEIGILICIAVAAVTLVGFASQMITVKLATRVFRLNMRKLTEKLVEMHHHDALLYNTNSALVTAAYTNGCRYAGVVSARSLSIVFKVVAIPVFMGYCIYLSPELSGLFGIILIIALPFHFVLMHRGLQSTRDMIRSGSSHRASKTEALTALANMPIETVINADTLFNSQVAPGSDAFLLHFERRRALAAYSKLVSGTAFVAVFAILILALSDALPGITPPIGNIIAFAVAVRFLGDSASSLASFITTTVSITPLLEGLDDLLHGDFKVPPKIHGAEAFAEALVSSSPKSTPQQLIVTSMQIDQGAVRRLLQDWKGHHEDTGIITGSLPTEKKALSLQTQSNPVLDTLKALRKMAPDLIIAAAESIASGEFDHDQRNARVMRIKVALFADIADIIIKKRSIAFVNSIILGQLGSVHWKTALDIMASADIKIIMVMNTVPRRMVQPFNPEGVWIATFDKIKSVNVNASNFEELSALLAEANESERAGLQTYDEYTDVI